MCPARASTHCLRPSPVPPRRRSPGPVFRARVNRAEPCGARGKTPTSETNQAETLLTSRPSMRSAGCREYFQRHNTRLDGLEDPWQPAAWGDRAGSPLPRGRKCPINLGLGCVPMRHGRCCLSATAVKRRGNILIDQGEHFSFFEACRLSGTCKLARFPSQPFSASLDDGIDHPAESADDRNITAPSMSSSVSSFASDSTHQDGHLLSTGDDQIQADSRSFRRAAG